MLGYQFFPFGPPQLKWQAFILYRNVMSAFKVSTVPLYELLDRSSVLTKEILHPRSLHCPRHSVA